MIAFYLSAPDNAVSREDVFELEKELKTAGTDVAAFDYVRKTREISRMMTASNTGGTGGNTPVLGGNQGGELFKGFGAFGSKVGRVIA